MSAAEKNIKFSESSRNTKFPSFTSASAISKLVWTDRDNNKHCARRNENKSWNSSDLDRGTNMFQLKIIVHGKALPLHKMHTSHIDIELFFIANASSKSTQRDLGVEKSSSFQFNVSRAEWLAFDWEVSMAESLSNLMPIFLRALIHQFLFCCLRDWRHGLVAMIFMIRSNYPFMLIYLINLPAHFDRQSPRNRKQSLNACFHDTHAAFLFSRKASSTLRSTSGIHSNLGYPRSTSLITEIECWLNGSSEQARQKRFVEQLCRVSCSRARSP